MITSIVVCYRPDNSLHELLEVLKSNTDHVVLVDNTPRSIGQATYLPTSSTALTILALGHNSGLAAGLNRGIKEAFRLGADAVSLWDQDSRPTAQTFVHLYDAYNALGERQHLISARAIDRTIGDTSESAPHSVNRAITSGLLIPKKLLSQIGGFREDFLVDMVDFDFSFRATSAGWTITRVPDAHFEHRIGDPTTPRKIFGRVQSSGHSPWRQYWIARNSAILCREHRDAQPIPTAELNRDRILWFANALLGGPRRFATLVAIARGVNDARSGQVTNRYSEAFR